MKLFFISDIHGSSYYMERARERFEAEGADYMVILGDILYHGARNELPRDYMPKKVIEILNGYGDRIIAVRGNCDSEVDDMVLDFPLMASYSNILYEGRRLFLTHGHVYNRENMISLEEGQAFIYGHTHIFQAEKIDGIYFLNPGSISLPKDNNPPSYAVLEDGIFSIRDLEGNPLREIELG